MPEQIMHVSKIRLLKINLCHKLLMLNVDQFCADLLDDDVRTVKRNLRESETNLIFLENYIETFFFYI